MNSGEVGVAFKDRPGKECPSKRRISAFGILSESVQLNACEANGHPIAVGETVEYIFVTEESERLDGVPACFDQQPGFGESRQDFIQILVFGLFCHRMKLDHGSRGINPVFHALQPART